MSGMASKLRKKKAIVDKDKLLKTALASLPPKTQELVMMLAAAAAEPIAKEMARRTIMEQQSSKGMVMRVAQGMAKMEQEYRDNFDARNVPIVQKDMIYLFAYVLHIHLDFGKKRLDSAVRAMWETIGELEKENISGEVLALNIIDETGLDIKALLDELWKDTEKEGGIAG